MAFVTYIEHDGAEHKVEVPDGDSLMHGALNNGVEGIVGECGGGLACATCHCYVDASWVGLTGEPEQAEREMLEAASAEVKPNSRLSCQITVTEALDGLVVRLPESQY